MDSKKQDLALAYVLGELDDRASAAVEVQAKHDEELRQAIRVLQDGMAAAVRVLPQQGAPATAYRGIERRLAAAETPFRATARQSHPVGWAVLGGLAALLIAGFSIGGYEWLRGRDQSSVLIAELMAGRTQIRPLAIAAPASNRDGRFMQLASLAERLWDAPDKTENRGTGSDGYAVFDPTTNEGFIAIREIAPLQPHQQYHLWFVDHETGRLHDAGPLPLDRATRGMFFFSLPIEKNHGYSQPSFFLTLEDTNAPARATRPRGKVVLGQPI